MIKVIWISDLHIGAKTDNIDRNPEIVSVTQDAIKLASKYQKEGLQTYFIIGGDIFHKNSPSDELVNLFIKGVLNPVKKLGLKTIIIAGNHDTNNNDKDHKSCLEFIRSSKVGYENVTLIDDIAHLHIKSNIPVRFTFLPHITRSNIVGTDFKNTQDYIESKCQKINSGLKPEDCHIVFSHLNVRGAHGGSEENLLCKSEAYLPKCFLEKHYQLQQPIIINGHIHSRQVIDNINLVGSPIYIGFGESEEKKYFLDMSIGDDIGEGLKLDYIETNCKKFKQLDIDLSKEWDGITFLDLPEVAKFVEGLDSKCIVKINPVVRSENCSVNWLDLKHIIEKSKGCFVKEISPKVIRQVIMRSVDQKANLSPKEAVATFLRTQKPRRAKDKFNLANNYL